MSSELKSHYSLTNQWAIGIHSLTLDSKSYAMIQNNLLLKRWNQKLSQGNIYFFSGLGTNLKESNIISHLDFKPIGKHNVSTHKQQWMDFLQKIHIT